MNRYFLKTLGARFRAGPALYLLAWIGVALGVASVISIQILNRSAIGAFEGSVRAISGDSDLTVLGRTGSFDDRIFPDVLGTPGVAAAWPLLRMPVAVAGRELFFLELYGVDLFSAARMPWRQADGDLTRALSEPGWVAVTPELAADLGLEVGDRFEVSAGSRRVPLRIGALVDFHRLTPLASRKLAVMDLSQAQALLDRDGRLHQIDLRAADAGDLDALRQRLRSRLGDSFRIVTQSERQRQARGLLQAFRLNLTALSLISLFVGVFLIYASTQAALIRRREEFGLLRSLGATPAQVFRLILGEAALLGLLGVAAGLPLGRWVAAANVDTVSRTVSNLYLLSEIETLQFPWSLVWLGAGIGLGGALAGAVVPAVDMSRRDPMALLAPYTLQERLASFGLPLALAAAGLLGTSWGWYRWFGREYRPAGFVLGVAVLLAMPLATPFLVRTLTGSLRARSFGITYSLKALSVRLHNSSVAIAALAIAVSMLVGITLMIGAFRRTVETWIRASVQADIYISTESSLRAGSEAVLAPEIAAALAEHPGVRAADRLRRIPVEWRGFPISLVGVVMDLPEGKARFPLIEGDPRQATRQVVEAGAALVSEPLARKQGIGVGDPLVLFGPGGDVEFRVAGVYSDYTTDRGVVAIDIGEMERRFGPGPIQYVALYLEEGRDPERTVDELYGRFGGSPLRIRSNRDLRNDSLRVFDQTFAVTRLLQVMSLLIAVCGITLSLLVQARERIAELALYRALGARRRQIFRVFLGEGLGMGVAGLLLGSAGGVALAMVLIRVINRAYFGWTIHFYWPWGPLAQEVGMILVAAFGASLYPALRASRTPATELSREDITG